MPFFSMYNFRIIKSCSITQFNYVESLVISSKFTSQPSWQKNEAMSQRLHLSAFIKSPPNCIKRRKEKWYTKAKAPQSNPTGKFYYAPCSSKRENPRKGYIFYGIALMSFRCGSFSAFKWRWKAYLVGTECAVVVFISDWRDSLFHIFFLPSSLSHGVIR